MRPTIQEYRDIVSSFGSEKICGVLIYATLENHKPAFIVRYKHVCWIVTLEHMYMRHSWNTIDCDMI